MTKLQKKQMVEDLTLEFMNASALIVCNYKGLTVKNLETIRKSARNMQIKVRVVKNTLATICMKNAKYPDLDLKDANVFIWGSDQIVLSKLVVEFAQDNQNNFALKVGCFDKERVDCNYITALSKLPSKEELIGMLLSVWTAPVRYFVTGLDNLKKQKEEK